MASFVGVSIDHSNRSRFLSSKLHTVWLTRGTSNILGSHLRSKNRISVILQLTLHRPDIDLNERVAYVQDTCRYLDNYLMKYAKHWLRFGQSGFFPIDRIICMVILRFFSQLLLWVPLASIGTYRE